MWNIYICYTKLSEHSKHLVTHNKDTQRHTYVAISYKMFLVEIEIEI